MGTFGQHFLAIVKGLVDEVLAVNKLVLFQVFNALKPQLFVLGEVMAVELKSLHIEAQACNLLQVNLFQVLVFLAEVGRVDVADAQTTARGLVGVGRADAFKRGADFHLAQSLLVGSIHSTMRREDEMGAVSNQQGLAQVETSLAQAFDLTF